MWNKENDENNDKADIGQRHDYQRDFVQSQDPGSQVTLAFLPDLLLHLNLPGDREFGDHQYDEVLQQGGGDEADAGESPLGERADLLRWWDRVDKGVVHVDDHQENSEEQAESPGDGVVLDGEADPADDDQESAGDEVGVDSRHRFPLYGDVEAGL